MYGFGMADPIEALVQESSGGNLEAEELFALLRQAITSYGATFDQVAVSKVKFEVEPWDGDIDLEALQGWKIRVLLTGYGPIKNIDRMSPVDPQVAADPGEMSELIQKEMARLEPEQVLQEFWEETGRTLAESLEAIRKHVLASLDSLLMKRKAEVTSAEQALMALRNGVVLESIWRTDPALPGEASEVDQAREAAQIMENRKAARNILAGRGVLTKDS